MKVSKTSISQKKSNQANYRIFRVDESAESILPKKITMIKIHAVDDEDAYNQLKEYRKTANREYKYYVEPWSQTIIERDGKKYYYDDFLDSITDKRFTGGIFKRFFRAVDTFIWRLFIGYPQSIYYKVRDTIYLLKNKQVYQSSWSVDDAVLDVLKFNIPILMKYKHTLSWKMLDKAILEKHPEKDFDLQKFYETHHSGFGKDIEDRAVELEKKMFTQLVDDINAYRYYSGDYEYIDKKNKELVEVDKKLRSTLPLLKGSYDRYDHKVLESLVNKYWNRIWESVRSYGKEFND